MPVTLQTYRSLALEDPEHQWELFYGQLREKPATSVSHNRTMARLAHQLSAQLDIERFEVRSNAGRLSYLDETYVILDVYVVPVELIVETGGMVNESLEVISAPLPFVAEVWSPSTGSYDTDRTIPEYQRRGDREVWQIHPYERTVSIWSRDSRGDDRSRVVTSGRVQLTAMTDVVVDIDALFALG
ncbi:MAG: Uma2 family endonuclease [Thermomicrobiales bacterium]|nr:Uma2 family endonuclease [Thermomicrobiales bacterium]